MSGSGKLAGKTEWAGRRRPVTRRAGYSVQAVVELDQQELVAYALGPGEQLRLEFAIPETPPGGWAGFGGWFLRSAEVEVEVERHRGKVVLTEATDPNWAKVGGLWRNDREVSEPATQVRVGFRAAGPGRVALYGMQSGPVVHEHLSSARPAILRNMWQFAPEANFYVPTAAEQVVVHGRAAGGNVTIALKSCNRCGRFLPVNLADERAHLSFSNHCVAERRRPCRHAGFGRVRAKDSDETVALEYGYQLECRFCKKFEVNAAHNPQRSASQMKEDGARRRHFELLLERLYEASPQLAYRRAMNSELALDVWNRFDRGCFKCGAAFATPREMHLDHTRPLALLWPLDGTATALCATHNSEKRDRFPSDYYSPAELSRLAEITGIARDDLVRPGPNLEAVELLATRLDWFRDVFLTMPVLQRVHDGKLAADLLVKALQKALDRCPGGAPYRVDA